MAGRWWFGDRPATGGGGAPTTCSRTSGASTKFRAMAFGRKKRGPRGRDPFGHLADERRAAEAEAWFLQPDDAPPLDVEAGISSNIAEDDVDRG